MSITAVAVLIGMIVIVIIMPLIQMGYRPRDLPRILPAMRERLSPIMLSGAATEVIMDHARKHPELNRALAQSLDALLRSGIEGHEQMLNWILPGNPVQARWSLIGREIRINANWDNGTEIMADALLLPKGSIPHAVIHTMADRMLEEIVEVPFVRRGHLIEEGQVSIAADGRPLLDIFRDRRTVREAISQLESMARAHFQQNRHRILAV